MRKKRFGARLLALALICAQSTPYAQSTVAGFTAGSFRVTETGAATYAIPIQVPPGKGGIAPSLTLAYSTQGAHGLPGMGWSISGLSAIHRCPGTPAQGEPRGSVSYDANDRFCLDGQRLIKIAGTTYGGNGTEYRTERESFTRIISYGSTGNGPEYFKAWTKSGQVIEYGNTAGSRILAVKAPNNQAAWPSAGTPDYTVRVWAANQVTDAFDTTPNNPMTFTYAQNTTLGGYRPTAIEYSGNSVVFEYVADTDLDNLGATV